METRTYTIDLQITAEVRMTSPGCPATGPTYSSGGEPAEGPEFEIDSYTIGKVTYTPTLKDGKSFTKISKEGQPSYVSLTPFEEWLSSAVDEALWEKAGEDDWSEPDYIDEV